MGLKRLLARLGAGSAEVETILDVEEVQPGGTIQGRVHLLGGEVEQTIQHVTVGLEARAAIEAGDELQGEIGDQSPFRSQLLAEDFTLRAHQAAQLPFSMPVPWECPVTMLGGSSLPGVQVGLTTELAIAHSIDRGDLDMIEVHPLVPQELLLAALVRLGFGVLRGDLVHERLTGAAQELPFHQVIELEVSPRYTGVVKQLRVALVTGPTATEVILDDGSRSGLRPEAALDADRRFVVEHDRAEQVDWERQIHQRLVDLGERPHLL